MKASLLAVTIVLAGCANGLMLADAPVTLDPGTTAPDPTKTTSTSQAPSHIMVHSVRGLGMISMELQHGSPSEEQWAKADSDAQGKCREWGYEEAEVTGTRQYEYRGESSREYRCRGRISASTSQASSHIMVYSSPSSGTISMQLKHGDPSEEQWAKADSDAHGKCREWGYEEAEVTGTMTLSLQSHRQYQCRGRISTSNQELKSEQIAEIKAWNDALEQDQVPQGFDMTNLTLVSRHGDNQRLYIDQSTMRTMLGNKARLQTVTFSCSSSDSI